MLIFSENFKQFIMFFEKSKGIRNKADEFRLKN
jgi:hypothetical protein